MNFGEVVAEVVRITKRPDKVIDIKRAVNAACLLVSMSADWDGDLQEATPTIDDALYAQNLALSTFTRFRKFAYIRPVGRNKLLSHLAPNKIFANGKEATDVFYTTGTDVVFKLCKLASSLYVGWYAYPATITADGTTNWLLTLQPYLIIDKASAAIFTNVGDDASAKKHTDAFNEAYSVLLADHKQGATV